VSIYASRAWIRIWSRFFFFQAEDGIRDRTVTGVQTCALPIFGAIGSSSRARARSDGADERHSQLFCARRRCPSGGGGRADGRLRSEERRVGKEGRTRWSG